MMQKIEHDGVWVLPREPDDAVPGTLTFDPEDGISLRLIGALDVDFQASEITTIWGRLAGGGLVTLFDCFVANHQINYPGMEMQRYHSNLMVVGAHIDTIANLTFNRLQLHLESLAGWAEQLSGFEIQANPKEKRASIRYELPDPVEAVIDEDFNLRLEVEAEGPRLTRPQKEASIREKTYFSVESSGEVGWETWSRIVHNLRNLISLAVRSSVRPIEITGRSESAKRELDGNIIYEPLHVYYSLVGQWREEQTILPHRMLFSLRHVRDSFQEMVQNWFSKAELLEPVFNQYFSDMHAPAPFLQGRFINLVQAVEAYHRRTMPSQELPDAEHAARMEAIVNSVPKAHKDWLASQLRYSNEVGLRRRIKDLVDRYATTLEGFIDRKRFAHKVVMTRNYLIHYDDDIKDQASSGVHILFLVQKLRTILEISFLHELGFGEQTIADLMQQAIGERAAIMTQNT